MLAPGGVNPMLDIDRKNDCAPDVEPTDVVNPLPVIAKVDVLLVAIVPTAVVDTLPVNAFTYPTNGKLTSCPVAVFPVIGNELVVIVGVITPVCPRIITDEKIGVDGSLPPKNSGVGVPAIGVLLKNRFVSAIYYLSRCWERCD
jgi:hypothetical protein